MPYSNGRIYVDSSVTPPIGVSIYDIQQALGVSDNSIVNLCQKSQINKFAKWKPFRFNAIKFDSESARLTAAKAVNFGTNIVSCGRLTFAANYQNQWSHLAPRDENGGNLVVEGTLTVTGGCSCLEQLPEPQPRNAKGQFIKKEG